MFHLLCTGAQYNFNGQWLSTEGVFADTLSSTTGCDSVVTLQLSVVSGMDELQRADAPLQIWPNPANDILHLQWNSAYEGQPAIIYNAIGEEVLRQRLSIRHQQFAIRHFPAGVYLLRIGNSSARFVKE